MKRYIRSNTSDFMDVEYVCWEDNKKVYTCSRESDAIDYAEDNPEVDQITKVVYSDPLSRAYHSTPSSVDVVYERYQEGQHETVHSSEDFVVDYPIRDEDPDTFIKRWAKREAEDEADYYDLTHNEGKYAEVESSDYIPDTTERYPEGKKSYVDYDYEDEPMQDTLENVINYLKERYYELYINEIEVFDKTGKSELVTDSFDDVLQSYAVPSKMLCNDTVVDEENGKIEIYLA